METILWWYGDYRLRADRLRSIVCCSVLVKQRFVMNIRLLRCISRPRDRRLFNLRLQLRQLPPVPIELKVREHKVTVLVDAFTAHCQTRPEDFQPSQYWLNTNDLGLSERFSNPKLFREIQQRLADTVNRMNGGAGCEYQRAHWQSSLTSNESTH